MPPYKSYVILMQILFLTASVKRGPGPYYYTLMYFDSECTKLNLKQFFALTLAQTSHCCYVSAAEVFLKHSGKSGNFSFSHSVFYTIWYLFSILNAL